MRNHLLLATLLALLLAACASSQTRLVAHATSSGTGDVRTDGDAFVIVGDAQAELAVRTDTGLPVFVVPPISVAKDRWYARSRTHDFDGGGLISEPLPWWARGLYLEGDLDRLALLGLTLTFEPEPEPPAPAEPPAATPDEVQ